MFDLVFCRNVLIYFDPPTKARALEAIAKQMAPDGLLYLGGAETVLGVTERFVPVPGDRGGLRAGRLADLVAGPRRPWRQQLRGHAPAAPERHQPLTQGCPRMCRTSINR